MSFSALPPELRIQIYHHAYHLHPPRTVHLATLPHSHNHPLGVFCPRYSPTPPPTIFQVSRESRRETQYLARSLGHVVCMRPGRDVYVRWDVDLLYLPLDSEHTDHMDDCPDVGLLAHLCSVIKVRPGADKLRNLAFSKVEEAGFRDGSLSNVLRNFANISRFVMVMPREGLWSDEEKERFVNAARRIRWLYGLDIGVGVDCKDEPRWIEVEVAERDGMELRVIPREVWGTWVKGGIEWALSDCTEPLVINWRSAMDY